MAGQWLLFNPITGLTAPTDKNRLIEITGMVSSTIRDYKKRLRKLKQLNRYIIDEDMTREQQHIIMRNEVIEGEIWKTIQGSNDKYAVSDKGRVMRLCKDKSKNKIIIPYIKDKYLRTHVTLDGKHKEVAIHGLVARHFVENDNPSFKTVTYHKNEDIYDNEATNIEWIDKSTLGKLTAGKSKAIPVIRLDPKTLEPLQDYPSMAQAGRDFFLNRETIRQCVHGEIKTAGGYVWIEKDNEALMSIASII